MACDKIITLFSGRKAYLNISWCNNQELVVRVSMATVDIHLNIHTTPARDHVLAIDTFDWLIREIVFQQEYFWKRPFYKAVTILNSNSSMSRLTTKLECENVTLGQNYSELTLKLLNYFQTTQQCNVFIPCQKSIMVRRYNHSKFWLTTIFYRIDASHFTNTVFLSTVKLVRHK